MNMLPKVDVQKAYHWSDHVKCVSSFYRIFGDNVIRGMESHKDLGSVSRKGDEDSDLTFETLTGAIYTRLHWVLEGETMQGKVVFYRPADPACGRLLARPVGCVRIHPDGDLVTDPDSSGIDVSSLGRMAVVSLVMRLAAAIEFDESGR